MTFYIQTNKEGYITDCVESPYNDYIVVDLDLPLPSRFIAGVYKYLGNGNFELDEVKMKLIESESDDEIIDKIE